MYEHTMDLYMHQTDKNRHLRWSSKTSNPFEMLSGIKRKTGKCLHVQKWCVENNVNGSVMVAALTTIQLHLFGPIIFQWFQWGKYKMIFHNIDKHKTGIALKCACANVL